MSFANTRALATLLCAVAAGALIWAATQFDSATQGGYWSSVGLLAAAGMTVVLSQMLAVNRSRVRSGFDPGASLGAFLPVLLVAGWIILAASPSGSVSHHILSWSSSIGIKTFVTDMSQYWSVLAFGLAVIFDLCLRSASQYATERASAQAGPSSDTFSPRPV